jgi:hypothetical protein
MNFARVLSTPPLTRHCRRLFDVKHAVMNGTEIRQLNSEAFILDYCCHPLTDWIWCMGPVAPEDY